jgi:transcriptional regulator with XRE-family HTH domain
LLPDISHLHERRKLAGQLKAARESTGLSGSRFAEELGWPQSRVSRIETGTIFPSEEYIRAWAAAAQADAGALLAQRDRAQAEYATWRKQGTGAAKQASVSQLERASQNVAKFQPVVIPSQLRTAGYAAEYLRLPLGPTRWGQDDAGIDAMVAAQMDRQNILYEPGRLFRIIILEAALTTRLVSPTTMAAQLDRLLALTLGRIPSLDFRIIPASRPVPVFPLSGFVIFDDHLVSIETLTGEQRISDPDEVKAYTDAFELLHAAGVSGREAGVLIRAALVRLGDSPVRDEHGKV